MAPRLSLLIACLAAAWGGAASAGDPEAAEMVALSKGPPPEAAALDKAAARALYVTGAGPEARAWAAYWLGPGRHWFSRWRARCVRIAPLVAPLAERAGMPPDWLALMLVESGCNPRARSRLGALGPWQLMPGTARELGLEVGPKRDERLLLEPATRAAGALLSKLHACFSDWDLALTAYNAGPDAVRSALAASGCKRLACLRAAGRLSPEAVNFVPKVRAAAFLLKSWDALTAR